MCALADPGVRPRRPGHRAPLAAADVRAWLGEIQPDQIFDLRDTSASDPIPGAVSLDHIFKQIEKTRALLIPRLETIRTEI